VKTFVSRSGGKKRRAPATTVIKQECRAKEFRTDSDRFEAVMAAAEKSGLLKRKSSRIAGRVSPALLEQAKKRTGIEADTDLIEFALANIALEDNFAESFKDSRGKIDAELKLGF
jgi:hypothetical protein